MQLVDLSKFRNGWYQPGRPLLIRVLWFFVGAPLLRSSYLPGSAFRRCLLRLFGAEVGSGVVIKPGVRVKYPWRLKVGQNAWLGEDCWLDNVGDISIGANACLSQGVYVCTGSHASSDPAFGLILSKVELGSQCWIGARAMLYPGVIVGEGAIAAGGSVVGQSIGPWEVHAGNPARLVKHRTVRPAIPTLASEDHRFKSPD